jgi:hypothetical protein
VQRHLVFFQRNRLSLAGTELPDQIRIRQFARNQAVGVVIAPDHEDLNAPAGQFADRANEEQSPSKISPAMMRNAALLAIVSLTSAATARRPA